MPTGKGDKKDSGGTRKGSHDAGKPQVEATSSATTTGKEGKVASRKGSQDNGTKGATSTGKVASRKGSQDDGAKGATSPSKEGKVTSRKGSQDNGTKGATSIGKVASRKGSQDSGTKAGAKKDDKPGSTNKA